MTSRLSHDFRAAFFFVFFNINKKRETKKSNPLNDLHSNKSSNISHPFLSRARLMSIYLSIDYGNTNYHT